MSQTPGAPQSWVVPNTEQSGDTTQMPTLDQEDGAAQTAGVQIAAEHIQPDPVQVNLLPQFYRDRLLIAAGRRRALMIMGGAAALIAVLFMLSLMQVGAAVLERDSAQSAESRARAELAKYNEIPQLESQINELERNVSSALSNEVLFSDLIDSVVSGLPPGTQLNSISVTLAEPGASSGSGATGSADYGDLTIDGSVPALEGGALLLNSLRANLALSNTWLASLSLEETEGGEQRYTFSLSSDLSEEALSQRFSQQSVN